MEIDTELLEFLKTTITKVEHNPQVLVEEIMKKGYFIEARRRKSLYTLGYACGDFGINKASCINAVKDISIGISYQDIQNWIENGNYEAVGGEFDRFWTKKREGTIKSEIFIDPITVSDFLSRHGYFNIEFGEGTIDNPELIPVQRFTGMMLRAITHPIKTLTPWLGSIVKHQISKRPELISFKGRSRIFNFIDSNGSMEGALRCLPTLEGDLIEDKADTIYLCFKDKILEVTKDGVKAMKNIKKKFIWAKNVCKSTEKGSLDLASAPTPTMLKHIRDNAVASHFYQFLSHTQTKDSYDAKRIEERTKRALQIFGYLIHGKKDPSYARAIYAYDESTDGTKSGRRGKSIFGRALSYIRSAVYLDGKAFDARDKFRYSSIKYDTQVVVLSDLRNTFDVESIYSSITGDFQIESKGKNRQTIPFSRAPKFFLESNTMIKDADLSTEGRIIYFPFSAYFNEQRTPLLLLKKRIFDDWDTEEWHRFFCCVLYGCHLYLAKEGRVEEDINIKLDAKEAKALALLRRDIINKPNIDIPELNLKLIDAYRDVVEKGTNEVLTTRINELARNLKFKMSIEKKSILARLYLDIVRIKYFPTKEFAIQRRCIAYQRAVWILFDELPDRRGAHFKSTKKTYNNEQA